MGKCRICGVPISYNYRFQRWLQSTPLSDLRVDSKEVKAVKKDAEFYKKDGRIHDRPYDKLHKHQVI